MSKNSSAQNIPQEATKLKKLAKTAARYMEMYFIKPNHCAIVTDEGPDVYDKTSGQIAPHGICALWEPNKDEIHGRTSHGKSDESTTNVSATFSCEICNEKFNSREELKQHTMQEHTDNISEGYNK